MYGCPYKYIKLCANRQKPIFKVLENLKLLFFLIYGVILCKYIKKIKKEDGPEWPKVEVEYNGEKISRPGILVEG